MPPSKLLWSRFINGTKIWEEKKDMFFYISFLKCLDLTEQKWLIVHSDDHNAYVGIDEYNNVTIIKDEFPENYDDSRIVEFEAISPEKYEEKQNIEEAIESGSIVNDMFKIKIGGYPICGDEKTGDVIECPGDKEDQKAWRVKSTSDGFRLYHFDKCLSIVNVPEGISDTISVRLQPCSKDKKNIWRIEMATRNIYFPEDQEDKYYIHTKPDIPPTNYI